MASLFRNLFQSKPAAPAVDPAPQVAQIYAEATRAYDARDFGSAIPLYERVIALQPNHAEAHLNLGNAYADLNDTARAEAHMRRAIALSPDLVEAHASLGFLLTGRGQIALAIQACQRAIDLRPDFALAHWNQGVAHLLGGQMQEGWAKYEWRKRRFPAAFSAPPGPEWDGGPLEGRTLLVLAEQGFGDTIQLCRYLPALVQGGARVLLECAHGLMPLLRCLPGLTLLPPHHLASRVPRPPYDVWVDQMSLPRLFGTTLETIPSPAGYLHPAPARAAAWEARLPCGLRIGLVWAGNPAHSNDRRRSIPTGALAPLIAVRADALVSLQVGRAARDITRMFGITDHSPYLTDFGETAAAVARMDLVITVDTAVAHLSAALGIPTWIMLPHAPDWRWLLDRNDSPWYSSVRLFRQDQPSDWAGVSTLASNSLALLARIRTSTPNFTWSSACIRWIGKAALPA